MAKERVRNSKGQFEWREPGQRIPGLGKVYALAGVEGAQLGKPDANPVPGRFYPGDPRINRTIPGPGRPRSEVKERLSQEREKNVAFLMGLRDDIGQRTRDRLEAVALMLAYDLGKPAQVIEGDGEQLIVTVRTATGADPWAKPAPPPLDPS